MARATNGLGQFRGKVGSVVFRVSQGQQIASAYQPAVKNPKSNLQTAQRNKMYLASQISKLVPREDIVGLAPNRSTRDRRSLFVKNIIINTLSTLVGEEFTSRIAAETIKFSDGEQLGFIAASAPQDGNVSLLIDEEIGEDLYNKLAIKVIILEVDNNVYSGYKSFWAELPQFSTAQNGTITINLDIASHESYVWVVPVTLNDGFRYSSQRKTLIQSAPDGDIVITGEYPISSAVYKWWGSTMVDSMEGGVLIPPSTGEDEVVNPDGPTFPNLG